MHVRIVGAGVAGLAAAVELAERGYGVEIADLAALGERANASWLAGGMLAPWCEAESAGDIFTADGAAGIAWWREHFNGVQSGGSLVLALPGDGRELDRFARRTRQWRLLETDEIDRLEPDLAGRFSRALHFPDEAHLDPRAAMAALEARLAALGVEVEVARREIDGAGIIIDCRGFAARETLDGLRGVRGEMIVVRSRDVRLHRPVRLLHPRHPVYIVPRHNGDFMVGATMIETSHAGPVTARSAIELLSTACALHPAFGEAEIVETGAAVRPAFTDNLPAVRRVGNVFHLNGMYRHGFLLAPAMACRLSSMLAQIHQPEPTRPLHEDIRQRQAM